MNLRRTFGTAKRVLQQLSHDHRTIGLILFVPSLLMTLMYFLFDGNSRSFTAVGGTMLAVFPFVIMFLITSIATLRERTSGTLERLMALPLGKLDLILGYAIVFGLLAIVQVGIALFVSLTWLDLNIAGSVENLLLVSSIDAVLGVALGLCASALARTEFQAVQFMPVFVLPQFLLCGLIVPRDKMADWLTTISDFLPLTYAVEAINRVIKFDTLDDAFWQHILIISLTAIGLLIIGSLTLRRRVN
jgi:ABC-2 type transport system permease protein